MFERDTPQSSHDRLWREIRRLSERLEHMSEHEREDVRDDCSRYGAHRAYARESGLEEEIEHMQRALESLKDSLCEAANERDCRACSERTFGNDLVCEIRKLREELSDWFEDACIRELDDKLDRCCGHNGQMTCPPYPMYPPYPPFPPYPPYPPYPPHPSCGCCASTASCKCGATQRPPAADKPCGPCASSPSSVSTRSVPGSDGSSGPGSSSNGGSSSAPRTGNETH